jgi:hypothetical protein
VFDISQTDGDELPDLDAVRPQLLDGDAPEDIWDALKTLVHELGHALLHGEGVQPSREIAEAEVESVAFVVLDALGLASDNYSFPYVAQWSNGDPELVRTAGDRVIACAGSVLEGLSQRDLANRLKSDNLIP